MAGQDFEAQKAKAATREFRPVALGATASVSFTNTIRKVPSANVAARLAGSDPKLADEWVVYTTHWDHFGIGPAVNGDTIYRGAIDNASGTAGLLELARAMRAAKPGPARSVLFLFVTGEEQGLLGSTAYAEHPLYPLSKTLAVLNLDALNVHGRTRDLTIIGLGLSDLDDVVRRAAAAQGRVVKGDPMPEKGSYFRSDHFPFARKGVPSIHAGGGIDFVGQPADYGTRRPPGLHPQRLPQAVGRGEARLGPPRRRARPHALPPRRIRGRLRPGVAGVEGGGGVEGAPRRDDEGRRRALRDGERAQEAHSP